MPRTIKINPLPGDNSSAIRAALHELRDGGRLVLAPGRYRCRGGALQGNGRTRDPGVAVHNLKRITLEGNGATLVGHDIAGLCCFTDCEDITIRNLTVDWDPLPHTSGRVVAQLADQHAFDLEPMIPADPPSGRIVQAIIAYNPELHRMGSWEIYQTQGERDAEPSMRLANGNLRVFQRRPGGAYSFNDKLPEIGSFVIVRHQVYGYDAFVFRGCGGVLLEDLTVRAVPGMAVIGWRSRDITIRRIKVVPADGGWMSATADAMHFGGCRGLITVEDSEFAGMGDDAVNIHGMYGLATRRLDDHTLEAGRARMNPYYDTERGTWDEPQPGDIIEYGGGKEPLLPQGQLTVASAHQDPKASRVVISFREALPQSVGEGSVLTNVSGTPAVRIRNCHVHGNRARGMLIQTRDVVIEDCRIEDTTGSGIQICTDACDWWESLGVRDVTVRGCTFRRNCFWWGGAALQIFSDIPGGQSAAGVHKGIRILDNLFEDNAGSSAIHIGSAEDVELSGNNIVHPKPPLITIVNSRQVRIRDAGGWDIGRDIEIHGSSDSATISILRDVPALEGQHAPPTTAAGRKQAARKDDDARRVYWTARMEEANAFMRKLMDYPVRECGEPMVALVEATRAERVEVAFSDRPHAHGLPRLYFLRQGLVPSFLAAAREMNARGWVLKVEDGYRTLAMQRELGRQAHVFRAILRQVCWECGEARPPLDLLFRRLGALVAIAPKVGTHMSGSAVDISVLSRDTGEEIDRGGPYLEMSERTPMASPFVSAQAAENRRAITDLMAQHGFVTYPWEFWHYNAGDADAEVLQNAGRPARYGAVHLDPANGQVTPITDPTAHLHSEAELRALLDDALAASQ